MPALTSAMVVFQVPKWGMGLYPPNGVDSTCPEFDGEFKGGKRKAGNFEQPAPPDPPHPAVPTPRVSM